MIDSPYQEDSTFEIVTSFSLQQESSTTPFVKDSILGGSKSSEIPLLPLLPPVRHQEIKRQNSEPLKYSGDLICESKSESLPFVNSQMCHVFQSDFGPCSELNLICDSGTMTSSTNPLNAERHSSKVERPYASPSLQVMEDRTLSSLERHGIINCNNMASLPETKDPSSSYEVEPEGHMVNDEDTMSFMYSDQSLSGINTALNFSKLFQQASDENRGNRREGKITNLEPERNCQQMARVEDLNCDSFKVSIPLIRNMSMVEVMNVLSDPRFLENWCEPVTSLVVTNQNGFSPSMHKTLFTLDNVSQPIVDCCDNAGRVGQVDAIPVSALNETRKFLLEEASGTHPGLEGVVDEKVKREEVRSGSEYPRVV
jgi:hypothetical protein